MTPAAPEVEFWVSGLPRTTQTGSIIRLKNGRRMPLRRNPGWSDACHLVARQHAPRAPLAGPVAVTLTFSLPMPKRPKFSAPAVRPDAENLCKGLLDAWNGVLWQDDGQIVDLHIVKRYASVPGVTVTVRRA